MCISKETLCKKYANRNPIFSSIFFPLGLLFVESILINLQFQKGTDRSSRDSLSSSTFKSFRL
ncbi:hypothetical protein NMG60_11020999 [Bertholletia excelsa]